MGRYHTVEYGKAINLGITVTLGSGPGWIPELSRVFQKTQVVVMMCGKLLKLNTIQYNPSWVIRSQVDASQYRCERTPRRIWDPIAQTTFVGGLCRILLAFWMCPGPRSPLKQQEAETTKDYTLWFTVSQLCVSALLSAKLSSGCLCTHCLFQLS